MFEKICQKIEKSLMSIKKVLEEVNKKDIIKENEKIKAELGKLLKECQNKDIQIAVLRFRFLREIEEKKWEEIESEIESIVDYGLATSVESIKNINEYELYKYLIYEYLDGNISLIKEDVLKSILDKIYGKDKYIYFVEKGPLFKQGNITEPEIVKLLRNRISNNKDNSLKAAIILLSSSSFLSDLFWALGREFIAKHIGELSKIDFLGIDTSCLDAVYGDYRIYQQLEECRGHLIDDNSYNTREKINGEDLKILKYENLKYVLGSLIVKETLYFQALNLEIVLGHIKANKAKKFEAKKLKKVGRVLEIPEAEVVDLSNLEEVGDYIYLSTLLGVLIEEKVEELKKKK